MGGHRHGGCLSRDTWESDDGRMLDVEHIIGWIETLPERRIDGVTISGGEPFDQPAALAVLLRALRGWADRLPQETDLLCYSGYPLRQLEREHRALLDGLDAIIAEPFRRTQPTELIWRGSANQRLVALSELGRHRYAPYQDLRPARAPMQVTVGEQIAYIGVPRIGDLDRLTALAKVRGVRHEGVSWQAQ